jgi:hypothetical protein
VKGVRCDEKNDEIGYKGVTAQLQRKKKSREGEKRGEMPYSFIDFLALLLCQSVQWIDGFLRLSMTL